MDELCRHGNRIGRCDECNRDFARAPQARDVLREIVDGVIAPSVEPEEEAAALADAVIDALLARGVLGNRQLPAQATNVWIRPEGWDGAPDDWPPHPVLVINLEAGWIV